MSARLYCSISEIVSALELNGCSDEENLLSYIRAASQHVERKIGQFIPITEERRFDGEGERSLDVDPFITLTDITVDGTALTVATDTLFYPRNKWWENGCYSRIDIDPDASGISAWKNERDVVVLVGSWSKYSESIATGATVSSQTDSATALVVDNGSLISPGMVLLIDDEQELVIATGALTTISSKLLDGVIDSDDEIITVDSSHGILAGEVIRINNEDMRVLNITANDLTVDRGWNGTLKVEHANDQQLYVYRTFTVVRGVNGTTAAEHSSDAISRYIAPWDIHYICKQIASLMQKKAQSGFAGKTGNADLGEIFYHDEFPRKPIKEAVRTYRIPV